MMDNIGLSEEELQLLYTWVDDIPLSRPKRNIARDFSDGVLMAEIVKHFFPKLVQLHNYSAASSQRQKLYNWNTLNQKVFKKIGFNMDTKHVDDIVNCVPGAVERLLKNFQVKVTQIQQQKIYKKENSNEYVGSNANANHLHFGNNLNNKHINHGPYGDFDELSPRNSFEQSPPVAQQQQQQNRQLGGNPSNEKKKKANNMGGGAAAVANPTKPTNKQLPPQAKAANPPQQRGAAAKKQQDSPTTYPEEDLHGHYHPQKQHFIAYNEDYEEIIADKDLKITELNETVKLLESKISKLNLLIRLKDSKIHALTQKIKDT